MPKKDTSDKPKSKETAVFLLPSLFNKTVQLLLESRQYFSTEGREIEQQLDVVERMQFATEMSRITIRLSAVMAWLSVQKAIIAGDMSLEEAHQEYTLDGEEYGLTSNIEAEHILPKTMCMLLEESRDLYERVHRLHTQSMTKH